MRWRTPQGRQRSTGASPNKATMGLPIQVIKDVAEERGYSVDEKGYNAAESQHSAVSGGGQAIIGNVNRPEPSG